MSRNHQSVMPVEDLEAARGINALLVRAGSTICAFRLPDVIEVLRPQPVTRLPGLPPHVLGIAVIRAQPTPVVHLSRLLGYADAAPPTRWITLRLDDGPEGQRRAAVAVDEVRSLAQLSADVLEKAPSLAGEASRTLVESVAAHAGRFLAILRAARVLDETDWRSVGVLAAQGAAP